MLTSRVSVTGTLTIPPMDKAMQLSNNSRGREGLRYAATGAFPLTAPRGIRKRGTYARAAALHASQSC